MELILVILVLFGATDLSQEYGEMIVPGGPAAEAAGLTPDWSSIASTACSSYDGKIGTMDYAYSYNYRMLQFYCPSSKPCVLAINPETLTYATSQFTNGIVNAPTFDQIVGYVPGVTSGCITMYTTDYGYYMYQYSDNCTGDLLCLTSGRPYISFYAGGRATSLPNTTPAWNSVVSTACNQWPKVSARFNSHIDEIFFFDNPVNLCVLAIDVRTWMWVQANGNEVINVSYPLQSQISGFIPGVTTGCITMDASKWPPVYAYATTCNGQLLCSYYDLDSTTSSYYITTTTTTTTPNAPTTTRWIDWITLPDFVNSAGAASMFGFWILSFLAALLWLIQQ